MSDIIKEFEAFAACPLDLVCEPTPPLLFPDSNRPVFPLLARKQPKEGRLLATVRHRLAAPAPASELKLLKYVLGAQSRSFLRLYNKHNGFLLFKNDKYKYSRAGLEALPIRRWRGATGKMKRFIELSEADDRFGLLFGVAFARVPRTDDFLVVTPTGPRAGQIFLFEGDGLNVSKIASGFEDLLRRASKNPLRLMQQTGACMGFSDEQGIDWTPIRALRKQCV